MRTAAVMACPVVAQVRAAKTRLRRGSKRHDSRLTLFQTQSSPQKERERIVFSSAPPRHVPAPKTAARSALPAPKRHSCARLPGQRSCLVPRKGSTGGQAGADLPTALPQPRPQPMRTAMRPQELQCRQQPASTPRHTARPKLYGPLGSRTPLTAPSRTGRGAPPRFIAASQLCAKPKLRPTQRLEWSAFSAASRQTCSRR
jgi:hypothetical protein